MRRVKAQKTNPEQSVEELLTAEFLAMMEEHGPPVHVTGANATLKHLRNVAITLEKGNVDWEKKSAALREIRQLLDKHREEFCQAWPKCHRIVCPAIVSVLKSLRCAVQKEACVTIAFLCVNMTNSHGGGFTVGAELVIDQVHISQMQISYNTPDHLLLDSAPNLGPLISRWKINKFESC
jgi:hypothetical protein